MWKLLADVLEYHRSLVTDQARCEAFSEAIRRVVRPGSTVVDIGTGTGLLALFACQAGADRVYAIEQGAIADLAQTLFATNGAKQKVRLFRQRSTEVQLPERVDVVVSETLWNFGLGEGILATLADARRRFLKPHGVQVPGSVELRLAPIEAHQFHNNLVSWKSTSLGVDLSSVATLACNNVYRSVVEPEMLLSDPETLCELPLGFDAAVVSGTCDFVVRRAGLLHALGGWFAADLAPGVRLDNTPPRSASSWQHAILPLEAPVEVARGDLLRAEVQCLGDESAWSWKVGHFPAAHRSQRACAAQLCTLRGFPTARQRRAAP